MSISKSLVPAKGYPIAVIFLKSRKREFKAISRLFESASIFRESDHEVLLCFRASKGQVLLFQSIFSVVGKWAGTLVFSNGEPESHPWKFYDVLSCYVGSIEVENKEKYCQWLYNSDSKPKKGTITISLKVPKPTFFPDEPNMIKSEDKKMIPCRKLTQMVKEGSKEEVAFIANETRCITCPNFKF